MKNRIILRLALEEIIEAMVTGKAVQFSLDSSLTMLPPEIPNGVVVTGCYLDYATNSVSVLIDHPSFSPARFGCEPPMCLLRLIPSKEL